MAASTSPRPLCPEIVDRPAEDGVWRADRCLAAWSAAGMGRIAVGARAARIRRLCTRRARASGMAGTSTRQPELAIPFGDRTDVAGMAPQAGGAQGTRHLFYGKAGVRGSGGGTVVVGPAPAEAGRR